MPFWHTRPTKAADGDSRTGDHCLGDPRPDDDRLSLDPRCAMKIFFSVGEPSGDIHGANLIKDLRDRMPDVECVGFGGPKMKAAGCQLHADLTELAVMWIVAAILNVHRFLRLLWDANRYFRDHKPDAVVMIDFPGFNWWIARRAKAHGIPVIYYGTPQLWAWASWRVKKMRKFVDHILCKLPFEPKWYAKRGCQATYLGHPFFDEVERHQLDAKFMAEQVQQPGPLVAILPGSRTAEVANNLCWQLKAVAIVHRQVPHARFALASFKQSQADMAQSEVEASGLPIKIHIGKTSELIEAATCCLAVSGSVSLELMQRTTPTAIIYYISRRTAFMMRHIVRLKIKFITLVNLIAEEEPFSETPELFDPNAPGADRVPMPEYPTTEDKSEQLAKHLIEWLTDESARQKKIAQLSALKEKYGASGASSRAADYIVAVLRQAGEEHRSSGAHQTPSPHFLPSAKGQAARTRDSVASN